MVMPINEHLFRRTVLRRLAVAGGLAGLGSVSQACGLAAPPEAVPRSTAQPADAPRPGGTLRLDIATDPDTLDLQQTSNPASATVLAYLYPALLFQDFDKSYKPWLAGR